MKTYIHTLFYKIATITMLATAAFFSVTSARAVNFPGNGSTGFGGNIGNGTLSVTDDGTNIYGTMTCGNGGSMGGNALVIYIDTGVGGGFSTTTNFNDQSDVNHIVISGVDTGGSGRSVMTFTNGFAPQYAMSLVPFSPANFGGIWQLANGGNGSFTYKTSVSLSPVNGSTGPYTFSFPATTIGLTNNTQASIRIFGTYISTTAYRSTEAIAGNDYGQFGQGPYTFLQTAYATYNFAAPPTPSTPAAFQVDMTAQIASGAFNPGNGDTVYAAGTFQTNPWTGFQLTPSASNTNIYTGTYLDYNPTNTAEQFKFNFYSVANTTNIYEGIDNRPFTLQSGGVTNTLVYFDDVFPTNNSATTNALTFSIDMTAQIDLGNFNPSTMQIEALGTFENPKWTAGFILTNNPNAANTNIYSGTILDGNYPGSFENYKFVIVSGGNNTYESGNNRDFFTPTNTGTFPLAYFDGVVSAYSIPVTFQVDMTIPLAAGTFTPSNGDTVSVAGTFQSPNQWTAGICVLTNNPAATNSNVFSGTFIDQNQPGTGEQYKFQINPAGNANDANWESIANRAFLLASSAQILPVVTWNNQDINDVLLQATTVTFTVNMTNAVDIYGFPFDPSADAVVVNGNFMNPQWPDFWTDALLGGFDYTANLLQNNGNNLLYTGTFTVAAGSSLEVQYKYGIIHQYTGSSNTNADNEASFNLNHTRYIRTVGTYNFPVDIFGIQQTNLAAATEPAFGNLAIGSPSAGNLPISWLGLPGVHLQYTTNLLSTNWVDLNATTGSSSTNWPTSNGNAYFRLIQP